MPAPLKSLRSCAGRKLWPAGVGRAVLYSRSRAGRSMKLSLFVVGAVLPLGSLIWALLVWHGDRAMRRSERQAGQPPGK